MSNELIKLGFRVRGVSLVVGLLLWAMDGYILWETAKDQTQLFNDPAAFILLPLLLGVIAMYMAIVAGIGMLGGFFIHACWKGEM